MWAERRKEEKASTSKVDVSNMPFHLPCSQSAPVVDVCGMCRMCHVPTNRIWCVLFHRSRILAYLTTIFIGSSFASELNTLSPPCAIIRPLLRTHSICWFIFYRCMYIFLFFFFSSAVFVYQKTCAFFIQWLWVRRAFSGAPSFSLHLSCLYVSVCVCVCVSLMWNANNINFSETEKKRRTTSLGNIVSSAQRQKLLPVEYSLHPEYFKANGIRARKKIKNIFYTNLQYRENMLNKKKSIHKRKKWNKTKSERASERVKKPKEEEAAGKKSTGIQSVWVSEWFALQFNRCRCRLRSTFQQRWKKEKNSHCHIPIRYVNLYIHLYRHLQQHSLLFTNIAYL